MGEPGRKLHKRMLANRVHLFVFMTNRAVPYTNNVSERHLRPSVIFRKVTNGFRCEWGAKTYAAFRSVVSTAKANRRFGARTVFSTGIFQIMAIPCYTFLARKIDLRWLMLFGLACFTFSMWNFTPITHDWGWRELLIPQAFRGFSQQFAVAPTVTLTLGAIPPERLKLASGLFNLMRNLGGAIGIAVCGTILNDRTNLHFLRLAEHLNNTNSAMVELLGRAGAKAAALGGGDAVMGHAIALRQLWNLTMREAQTETYSDAFLALMLCLGLATAMVPLMRKVVPPKAPVADGH